MVGAVVITVLLEWLRFVEETIEIGSFVIAGIPGMRMVIFSVVLLFIILYRREGIIGGAEFNWDSVVRRFGNKKEAGKMARSVLKTEKSDDTVRRADSRQPLP